MDDGRSGLPHADIRGGSAGQGDAQGEVAQLVQTLLDHHKHDQLVELMLDQISKMTVDQLHELAQLMVADREHPPLNELGQSLLLLLDRAKQKQEEEMRVNAEHIARLLVTSIAAVPGEPELLDEAVLRRIAEKSAADRRYEHFGITEQSMYLWLRHCTRDDTTADAFSELEDNGDAPAFDPTVALMRLTVTSAPEGRKREELVDAILAM